MSMDLTLFRNPGVKKEAKRQRLSGLAKTEEQWGATCTAILTRVLWFAQPAADLILHVL